MARIEGRIVGRDGRPVAGAEVELSPFERTTRSDVTGRFFYENLEERRYWLGATLDDLYAGPLPVRPSDEDVELRLCRGTTLRLHVFADGAPSPAFIAIRTFAGMFSERYAITATETGAVTVRGIPPGSTEVTIGCEGREPERFHVSVADDPRGMIERRIELRKGVEVSGIVSDDAGTSLSGVHVMLLREGQLIYVATSGEDGRWLAPSIASGRVHVTVDYRDQHSITVGDSPVRDLALRAAGHGRIDGRVVDESGAPVGGAQVNTQRAHVMSDANGRFSFAHLSAGQHTITCWSRNKAARATSIVIVAHQTAELELVVAPAAIVGTVVDSKGSPIAGALVEAKNEGYELVRPSRTDSAGRFELPASMLGQHQLWARWPELKGGSAVQQVDAGGPPVTLVLDHGCTLRGQVVLEGKPLTYFGIAVIQPKQIPRGSSPIGIESADGTFELTKRSPGTWRVVVLGPGTRAKVLDDVVLEEGKVADLGTIELARGRTISGHVRDEAGAPIAGALIAAGRQRTASRGIVTDSSWLANAFAAHYEAISDARGAYVLPGIDPEDGLPRPPRIFATHPKHGASLICELPPGDCTVDLMLMGAGRIEAVLDGANAHHVIAYATRPDEPAHARVSSTHQNEFIEWNELPHGEYTIELASRSGQDLAPVTVTVRPNGTTRTTLAIRSTSIAVSVRMKEYRFQQTKIEPIGDTPRPRSLGISHHDGKVSFNYLMPGRYRVTGDGEHWHEIVVAAHPPNQEVDLE